jgi:hypothetical protein
MMAYRYIRDIVGGVIDHLREALSRYPGVLRTRSKFRRNIPEP